MRHIGALLAAFLIGLTPQTQAQSPSGAAPEIFLDRDRATDMGFGLVCPAGPVRKLPAPDTHLGTINQREDWQKIEYTTQTIPLLKGVGFGVNVDTLEGRDLIGVEVSVTHPAYPGTDVTRESWASDIIHDASNLNFFLFEFDFEMIPGDWTFQAAHQGELLFSVGFKIVPPARVPHLLGLCKGPGLLS